MEVVLATNENRNVRIDVEIEDVIDDIDWDEVVEDGEGVLVVDSTHEDIDEIRGELADAIVLH